MCLWGRVRLWDLSISCGGVECLVEHVVSKGCGVEHGEAKAGCDGEANGRV